MTSPSTAHATYDDDNSDKGNVVGERRVLLRTVRIIAVVVAILWCVGFVDDGGGGDDDEAAREEAEECMGGIVLDPDLDTPAPDAVIAIVVECWC